MGEKGHFFHIPSAAELTKSTPVSHERPGPSGYGIQYQQFSIAFYSPHKKAPGHKCPAPQ